MTKIGPTLRRHRLEMNLTQAEVANRLNLSDKSHVSKIERGERAVSLKLLAKYADLFGMQPSELLAECENSGQPGAGPGEERKKE